MPARHAGERRLQIGSIARARLQQTQEDEPFQGFAQGSAAYIEYLGELWFRGQAAPASKVSRAHERFDTVSDHLDHSFTVA